MIAPNNLPRIPDLDYDAIDAAVARATMDAVVNHARLGFAVPEWQDGRVVWVPPAEVLSAHEKTEFPDNTAGTS
jgi:hypothetical protein